MTGAAAGCGNCRHFEGDPVAFEAALPGLKTLSSAWASVRARDGLCARHERQVSVAAHCAEHALRPVAAAFRGPAHRG